MNLKSYILLITIGITSILFTACANDNAAASACIQPCATHTEAEKTISGKLAAKLETFKVDASAEASYKNSLKNDFPKLSDANAAFCLGLRAIDCYKKHKVIDQATAQTLAIETLRYYRSRKGISGGGAQLSPYERDSLRKSPEGVSILAELKQYNIQ
jgi:hypothetical protein